MRRTSLLIGSVAAFAIIAQVAFAADIASVVNNPPATPKFSLIHVNDLASLMANPSSHVRIYDANVQATRDSQGMIPGARALTSDDNYNIATELPSNKQADLVFYCANTQCMASHQAAERAVDAGYDNVSVMADGIAGWRAAGKPVEMPDGSSAGSGS
ncbi:MAG: rhodanese-like domain-containing protein [Candidatus Binataceae bacterium]